MLEPRRPWWRDTMDPATRRRLVPLLVVLVAINLTLQAVDLPRGVHLALLAVALVLVAGVWILFASWLRGRRRG